MKNIDTCKFGSQPVTLQGNVEIWLVHHIPNTMTTKWVQKSFGIPDNEQGFSAHVGLADRGSTMILISKNCLKHFSHKRSETDWTEEQNWFRATHSAQVIGLNLPQFPVANVSHDFAIGNGNHGYEFILRQDCLQKIGMDIMYSRRSLTLEKRKWIWQQEPIGHLRRSKKFWQSNVTWTDLNQLIPSLCLTTFSAYFRFP